MGSKASGMNAQARDELRAEMIEFACWLTEEDPDEGGFVAAIESFFAWLARIYRCSARAIREHYASEIGRLGEIAARPIHSAPTLVVLRSDRQFSSLTGTRHP
jgi:hypothetical protein